MFTRAKEAVITAVQGYKTNGANGISLFKRNLSEKSRTADYVSNTSSSVFRDNLNILASIDLNSKSLSSVELEKTLKPVMESLSSLNVEKTDDLQLFKDNPKAIQNLVLLASEYGDNPEIKDSSSKLLATIMRNSLSPSVFSSNADKENLEKFLKVIEASDKVEKYSAAVDFLSSLNGQRGGLAENLGKFYSTLEKGLDAGLGAVLSEPLQKGLIAKEISTILNDPMNFIETLKQSSTGVNTAENQLSHQILDLAASSFGEAAGSALDPKWHELFKNVISAKTDTQVRLAVGKIGEQMLETVNALSHHDSEVQSAANLLSLVKVNLGLYPNDSSLSSRPENQIYLGDSSDSSIDYAMKKVLVNEIYSDSEKNTLVWSNIDKVLDRINGPDLDQMIYVLAAKADASGLRSFSAGLSLNVSNITNPLAPDNITLTFNTPMGMVSDTLDSLSDSQKRTFLFRSFGQNRIDTTEQRALLEAKDVSGGRFFNKAFSDIKARLPEMLNNFPVNHSIEERLETYLALQKRTLEQEQKDFNKNFVALSEALNKLSMPIIQEDGKIVNSSGFGEILKQRLSDLYDGEMVFTKILESLGENDFEINTVAKSSSKTAQTLQLQQLVSSLQARQDTQNGDHNEDSMYFNVALTAIRDNTAEYERISSHNTYAAELLQKYNTSIPETRKEFQDLLNAQDPSNTCVQELNRYLVADQNSLLFKQILENKQELVTLGIYSDLERLVIKKVKLEQDLDLLFFKTMAAERVHRLSTGTKSGDIDLTNLMPSHGFDMEKYPLLKDSSIFKDQNALNSLIEAKEEKIQVINNLIDVTVKSFSQDDSTLSNKSANALAERFAEMLGVVKDSLFNEPNDRAAHNFKVNLQEYHSANINNTVLDQAPALAQRFLIQIMRFIENLLVDPQLAIANQGE
ncbi:MAG: hypothetical protein VKK32_01535 [Candidatus Melainabacteria bacterium]|nr:hypothetical protein [Candidatus Melainabacteria bacterium]